MTVLCFAIECLCLLYRLTACIPITIVGTTIPPWYVSLVIGYRVLGYCASCFSPCFVYSSYIPCMINMITTHPSIQLIHLINRCLHGFGLSKLLIVLYSSLCFYLLFSSFSYLSLCILLLDLIVVVDLNCINSGVNI